MNFFRIQLVIIPKASYPYGATNYGYSFEVSSTDSANKYVSELQKKIDSLDTPYLRAHIAAWKLSAF